MRCRRKPCAVTFFHYKLLTILHSLYGSYISWNLHEPEPGQFDFEGALDFAEYFRLAQKHGLVVIARLGPFINAEVDKVRGRMISVRL